MNITYKKQFVVFVIGNGDYLDCLVNYAGCPIYEIARFDYFSEAQNYITGYAQEWKDYLIQEYTIAICVPDLKITNNA